ncbi:hypothetical protein CPB86DRAFT_308002 [Serendipita vermifera]|nr:hypothetical protein CPB86DRAFT_308002 [Serendipita vermifera]
MIYADIAVLGLLNSVILYYWLSASVLSIRHDASHDPWQRCVQIPDNLDMQGFFVRLSLFVSQICYVILLSFSRERVTTVVSSVLLQNYALLIGSLASISREKLSPNDIHFAISAVHSPVFHYLLLTSAAHLIHRQPPSSPNLFHNFGRLRLPSQLLILGVIPLWIVLSGVTWLGISELVSLTGGTCVKRLSFWEWLKGLTEDPVWIYNGLRTHNGNVSIQVHNTPVDARILSIFAVFSVAINLVYLPPRWGFY